MGTHTDIRWMEWGEEAFERARKEGKPVLLDLSAVWCHWCHVMDETSYADDEVIQVLNEEFVPVRVDIDRRPDIRERYNFGGYPTTAFLNVDGDVIAGGTYIPPDQLKKVLEQVRTYFRRTGGQVGDAQRRIPREAEVAPPREGLTLEVYEEVLGYLLEQYDEVHGGFGAAPKFPAPDVLDLALYHHRRSGNDHFRRIVTKTLDAMAQRGMYDPVEGGFFRYSVTRDWSEPHYEKMLEVNVGLLRNCLHAYAALDEARYRAVAEDVLGYLEATLRDPEGGFSGSQDADEEYYGLPLEARRAREAPFVDRVLYADLNGQAIVAYLEAAAILGEPRYRDAALRTLERVEERFVRPDGGLFHCWDGNRQVDGFLGDYVHGARAFLAAYEHMGDEAHRQAAAKLADVLLDRLRDEAGLLQDRAPQEGDIGLLRVGQKPLVENAHAALLLLRLREATGQEAYGKAAREILEGFAGQYRRYSLFAAPYALAVRGHLEGILKLDLVGPRDDGGTRRVHTALLRPFEPHRVVRWLEPGTDAFQAAGYPEDRMPAVYACIGTRCSEPITAKDPWARIEAFRQAVPA